MTYQTTNDFTVTRQDGTYTGATNELVVSNGGTVTLPTPTAGEKFGVRALQNDVTIVQNGAIEGSTSDRRVSADGNSVFVSDGSEWYLMSGNEYFGYDIPDSVVTQPESGDRTHFDIDGFGSDYEIVQSSEAIVGDYVWESTNTNMSNSRNEALISTSGLNDYPQRGDEFRYYMMEIPSSSDNTGIHTVFGVQDSSNWYGVWVQKGSPVRLEKDDSFIAEGSVSLVDGQWYEVYVVWGSPTIEVTVYEVDDAGNRQSEVETISADDSEYDSGGVGWVLPGDTGGGIRHNGWVTD